MAKPKKGQQERGITVQEAGRRGGKARAANLSAKELSEQGKAAVQERWKKRKAGEPPS